MINQWWQLLANLEITESDSGRETLSEDELTAFEIQNNITLPADYKDFCQILGTGSLWDFVVIYSPSNYLLKTQDMIGGMIAQIIKYPSPDLNRDLEYINLLHSAFMFGEYGSGGSLIFWDLRTYSESDKSYDIYWADWETPECGERIFIGRNFFEFVRDFCYGTKSFELLPELMEGLSPEDITYTFMRFNSIRDSMIVSNYRATDQQGESDRIISQIFQLANNLEIDTDRAIVLSAIAKKYAETRQYERALQFVNTISDNAYKARTMAEVVLDCAEAIPVDEVTNTISQALQIAQEIEYEEVKWWSIGFIANCCFEAGRYEQALQISRTIPSDDWHMGILTKIAVAYAKAGQGTLAAETFARAFEQANTIENKYSRSYWWIRIAADYTEAGQGNKMPEILARSEQLLNALESIELESLESNREKNENLGNFAILYAQKGLYDLAFQFANALKEDEYSRFLALLSIAICYVDASLYSEAIAIVKPFRGYYATATLFRRISSEYAEQGQYDLAIETINYIGRPVEEDEYQAALTVVAAIRATAEAGDKVRNMLSQSLQIVNSCRASGLLDIVALYAKVGLYAEALEIVSSLNNQNGEAYALESIVRQIKM